MLSSSWVLRRTGTASSIGARNRRRDVPLALYSLAIICWCVCRKERAEIEALEATVEKLKVEHEAARKKWKATEKRYALVFVFVVVLC